MGLQHDVSGVYPVLCTFGLQDALYITLPQWPNSNLVYIG
jgi:hypothetical protein